jgi:2-dehydro-3-deoxyphosphooctonate aldolase (KDO 8-P synthase)
METDPHPLTAWRKQEARTLVALAGALDCAPSHLSQIESRKTNPSLGLIAKLQAITGGALTAEDFMPAETAPTARAVVSVGKVKFGNALPLKIIAGPCALESRAHALEVATALARIAKKLKIGLVFKTSFDKANRTSARGKRGIGLTAALPIFAEIRARTGLPVLTDVHEAGQCARLAEVVDVLQIPAFLCRQTDLLIAAAKTGRVINVKKGQFLAPWDMKNVVAKLTGAGNRNVLVTERGSSFGYNTLVSDMRALPILARETGAPVVFDATHSVQQPGGKGTASGGEREFVPVLARAAVAVGVAAVFIETHPDPDRAPSDGPNMVPLKEMERLLSDLIAFDKLAKAKAR